jgi:heme-degrading monooxygenase HmoA
MRQDWSAQIAAWESADEHRDATQDQKEKETNTSTWYIGRTKTSATSRDVWSSSWIRLTYVVVVWKI